jgi:hypothetical protein
LRPIKRLILEENTSSKKWNNNLLKKKWENLEGRLDKPMQFGSVKFAPALKEHTPTKASANNQHFALHKQIQF